jgi:hypothetical protein
MNNVICRLGAALALVAIAFTSRLNAGWVVTLPGTDDRLDLDLATTVGKVEVVANTIHTVGDPRTWWTRNDKKDVEGNGAQSAGSGYSSAFASNVSANLRASASASTAPLSSTQLNESNSIEASATARASNSQVLLLDFRESAMKASDLSTIYARLSLDGSFNQNLSREVLDENGGALAGVVSSISTGLFFNIVLESISADNRSFGGDLDMWMEPVRGGTWIFLSPEPGDQTSGIVDVWIGLELQRQALSHYFDPVSGDLNVTAYDGSRPESDLFSAYTWTQIIDVGAGQLSFARGVENSNHDFHPQDASEFDLANTLTFSHATLLDGSSLASAGIRLHHINALADGSGDPDVQPVPEPSSLMLAGIGAVGFVVASYRRKKRQAASAC